MCWPRAPMNGWRTRTNRSRVPMSSHRADRVLSRIRATPPGFVRTYGDVSPGAPRFAGSVLAACEDPDVPWQRIVRADGSLAKGEEQRRLLASEGTPLRGARVEMAAAWVDVAVLSRSPARR